MIISSENITNFNVKSVRSSFALPVRLAYTNTSTETANLSAMCVEHTFHSKANWNTTWLATEKPESTGAKSPFVKRNSLTKAI